MSELRPVLERLRDRFPAPTGGIEQLIRHRERKSRRQRLATIGTALAIGVAGALVAVRAFAPQAEQPKPAGPLPLDAIIFARASDRDAGIYAIEPDGSGVRKLIDAPEGTAVADPTWSPDGTRIAYVLAPPDHLRRYAGDGDIYVANADGTGITRLTKGRRTADPGWSPDGAKLVFRRDQGSSLFVMNADGSQPRELRPSGGPFPPFQSPAWSPDGARIAFTALRTSGDETPGVYLTNLDGTGTERVTGAFWSPSWSPDGTTLAYARPGGIYLHDLQTGVKRRLTICNEPEDCGDDLEPSWAPSGSQIVFARQDYAGSSIQIFVVNTNGTGLQQITSGPESNVAPSWRPADGAQPSRCDAPTLRPTYLPWVAPGDEIPPPDESYDPEIDRAQLSWLDPRVPLSEFAFGVSLTVYTYFPIGSDPRTDIEIQGVAGRLHRFDDSAAVSIHWDLPTSTCNFLELSYEAPNLTKREAITHLLKIARSLQ